jgi:uncharacterized membrane protein HdeD (DUF308 family)
MTAEHARAVHSSARWALGLRGLFGASLGVFTFVRPTESVAPFALVIAIWALVDGMTNVERAFILRGLVPRWWALLITGEVGLAFGIAALYRYPALSLRFAVGWTSLWVLSGVVLAIYVATKLNSQRERPA